MGGCGNGHYRRFGPADLLQVADFYHHIAVEHQEGVGDKGFSRSQGICCSELFSLDNIGYGYAEASAVAEVLADCLFLVADNDDNLFDSCFPDVSD